MGNTSLQAIFRSWLPKQQIRILMLGCDNAGKTTILRKLNFGEVVFLAPTLGFNLERVEHKNISIITWDYGGAYKLRVLWNHYYAIFTKEIHIYNL